MPEDYLAPMPFEALSPESRRASQVARTFDATTAVIKGLEAKAADSAVRRDDDPDAWSTDASLPSSTLGTPPGMIDAPDEEESDALPPILQTGEEVAAGQQVLEYNGLPLGHLEPAPSVSSEDSVLPEDLDFFAQDVDNDADAPPPAKKHDGRESPSNESDPCTGPCM